MRLLRSLLLLAVTPIYAQEILWEKSFGGRHAEYLTDIQPTADYGFIIGGSSLSAKSGNKSDQGNGDLDYWIWKMDEHGSPEWQKSFGGGASDLLQSVKTTHDGGFLLAGTSNSPKGYQKTMDCHGGNDYWVIKLDAKGNQMWQKSFGGEGSDELQTVVPTRDGGYLLAGTSSSSAPAKDNKPVKGSKMEDTRGNTDYWLVKIDSEGNEQWQKTYGGRYADQLRDAVSTKDGGFMVAGYSNSPASGDKFHENLGRGGDFWILKLDDKGNLEWQKTIGGTNDDQPAVVHQTLDLGFIIAGSSNSQTRTSKKGTDLWLVKLDTSGEMEWEEAYDIASVDILTSLVENEDGTFLVGAYSPLSSKDDLDREGINDYMAIKVNIKGEELWRKAIGSDGEDILKKVVMTRDGGYIMAGTSNPEFKGYFNKRQNKKKDNGFHPLDNSTQLEGARKLQETMDNAVNDAATKANDAVSDQINSATGSLNDAITKNNDSAFKVGVDSPLGDLLHPTNTSASNQSKGNNATAGTGPKPGAIKSRDKHTHFGGNDFWVVKLKDKDRPLKDKLKIEAIPNPVVSYTNVIIGFDFDTGTARLYDIGGRELQKFPIESRTVPVNLSGYPVGVYIVNVHTNKGEASVKVIKNE